MPERASCVRAQLANLMQEFVHSPDVPPETETRLRHFLASKASMCVADLLSPWALCGCRVTSADLLPTSRA